MNKHTSPPPERKWIDRATLVITSVTCVATLVTLWIFAAQLKVMRDEQRERVQENAAKVRVIAGVTPQAPTLLLALVDQGHLSATKVSATATITLYHWPTRHAERVLHTRNGVWESIDSDPNLPHAEAMLVDEPVEAGTIPLTFEDFEKTGTTVLISIRVKYYDGFKTVDTAKAPECYAWLPKYTWETAGSDYGGGPGLVPCDRLDEAIHDAEVHKADRRNS